MADVANTKSTGPASKGSVSGGKQFPLKDKQPMESGDYGLTNTSENARQKIMSLRVTGEAFSSDIASGLTRRPT